MVKRKAPSPASMADSPKKARTSKPTPTANGEEFEQFTPTSEFSEKYSLNLPGADAYYLEEVSLFDIEFGVSSSFLVH